MKKTAFVSRFSGRKIGLIALLLLIAGLVFWLASRQTPQHKPHIRQKAPAGSPAPENIYQKEFGKDYDRALSFLRKHKNTINQTLDTLPVNKNTLISVVFPELIRYSLVRDLFETAFLELAYIERGKKAADFSIGHFQMKPSFAERIEAEIAENPVWKKRYDRLVSYSETQARQKRKQRLEKLQNIEFQLLYAAAFCEIVQEKFVVRPGNVKFFASAYNLGFHRSKEQIVKHQNDKIFPFGKKSRKKQFSYSEISVYFYRFHFRNLF